MDAVVRKAPPGMAGKCDVNAVKAIARLREAGHEAYFAGGCVRDLLRQVTPADYDIATSATPPEVIGLFPDSTAVGKAFGVVRVPWASAVFEVATFRQDLPYEDGRHPLGVSFSDAATDAGRRDFTINALFYDPLAEDIVDYVGGCDDLGRRLIRTVGNPATRFAEDHLRMLRAVRFHATLGFELDPDLVQAIRDNARLLGRIAAERIRDEFTRILLESLKAGDALRLLLDLGLLDVFLPEVCAMSGQEQSADYHPEGDVFTHTVAMLNLMKTADPQLAYAVLLHDVAKPLTAKQIDGRLSFHYHAEQGADVALTVTKRLRFSSDDSEAICHMVRQHMAFINAREMRLSTLRRVVAAPTFPAQLELYRLDCVTTGHDLANHQFLLETAEQFAKETPLPRPWITGRDIMALGVPEGPEVGHWRKKTYELQLENAFPGRVELMNWLEQELAKR